LIASGNPLYDGLLKIYEVKQNTNTVEIFTEPVRPLAAVIGDMSDEEVRAGIFTIAVRREPFGLDLPLIPPSPSS